MNRLGGPGSNQTHSLNGISLVKSSNSMQVSLPQATQNIQLGGANNIVVQMPNGNNSAQTQSYRTSNQQSVISLASGGSQIANVSNGHIVLNGQHIVVSNGSQLSGTAGQTVRNVPIVLSNGQAVINGGQGAGQPQQLIKMSNGQTVAVSNGKLCVISANTAAAVNGNQGYSNQSSTITQISQNGIHKSGREVIQVGGGDLESRILTTSQMTVQQPTGSHLPVQPSPSYSNHTPQSPAIQIQSVQPISTIQQPVSNVQQTYTGVQQSSVQLSSVQLPYTTSQQTSVVKQESLLNSVSASNNMVASLGAATPSPVGGGVLVRAGSAAPLPLIKTVGPGAGTSVLARSGPVVGGGGVLVKAGTNSAAPLQPGPSTSSSVMYLKQESNLASTSLASSGLTSAGLASSGLVSTGLTSTGLASTGLTSTGLTSAGLTSTGLTSTGLASTGLTSAGLTSLKQEITEVKESAVSAPLKAEVPEPPQKEEEPEMDIYINNVVCSFSVRCHLNLKEIALSGSNVEYRRENGMVTMKLRHPYTTASIWSSGKVTCTGANTEEDAKIAARKFSRILQKLDEKYKNIRIKNWRIVNVLGTCNLPFGIKIVPFSQAFKEASYEPELHPGVTYKLKHPKATLKIFSTGSITVTAPSVANVQAAVEHIYPKVCEYQKPKDQEELKADMMRNTKRKHYITNAIGDKCQAKKKRKMLAQMGYISEEEEGSDTEQQ